MSNGVKNGVVRWVFLSRVPYWILFHPVPGCKATVKPHNAAG
jgi:hypothetical protein